ncbi:enediyne polyketide synthase [Sinosporangium album]|uniref:Enediyne polyketide synthase n=1 Tax=Sinosporangium album TaxID=504805 RepID=A0A1G8F2L1_9ACTN|nr:type I polyketide synthase [Sinosporangium album]SDH76375.1 enediyne polyketide synthase [Sinosporangium album]
MNIAIVGMACTYPDAPDPAALWENVLWRRRAFRRIPAERLDLSDYHSPDRNATDRTYSTRAALVEGWEFDRAAYRIPGAVHRVTDPAHWLALDTAARALADSGFPDAAGLPRERVAVVVGNTLTGEVTRARSMRLRWPYVRAVLAAALADLPVETGVRVLSRAEHEYLAPFPETSDESLAGGLSNTIAGRICNHFDFAGGGYAVDGACASSLLALITACRTLSEGGADFALAGGVDISLDPFELVGFAKAGALAAERMRVYDERSDGFWPGEGCGIVALMRADDAREQGLRIYAEIAGWGVSSDGRGGITRPEVAGQLLALRRAYSHAGVAPDEVGLFEGHGTGTALGDTTELTALARLLGRPPSPVALGSVKANIGHTKAAAGVAGLIKAAMSVATGVLPPTTGCERPHRLLTAPGAPLRVPSEPEAWPGGRRYAGVSAMGFGGINAHMVLTGPGSERRGPAPRVRVMPERLPTRDNPLVFAVSAADTSGGTSGSTSADNTAATLRRIAAQAAHWSEAEMIDLARELGTRPSTGPLRVAIVAGTPEQLAERAAAAVGRLARLQPGVLDTAPGVYLGEKVRGRVTLLFPGQGAPVRSPDGRSRDGVADTADAQPAILAASLSALRYLDRLGLNAGAAIGHSLGEIAGLVWAGCLSAKDARRLVRHRGQVMSELGRPGTGMISVAADGDAAERLMEGTGLVVAAVNGPSAYVLAGPDEDIAVAARRAADRGLAATVLPVSRAFHSPWVADCAKAMEEFLGEVQFSPPQRTLISTVTGEPLSAGDDPAALLREQITAPVRFWDAVTCVADDTDLYCEAGPGRTLSAMIAGVPAVSVDAFGRGGSAEAETAAALWAAGATTDLSVLYGDLPGRPIDIWRDRVFIANPCSRPSGRRAADAGGVPDEPHSEAAAYLPADEVLPLIVGLVAEAVELPSEAIAPRERLLSDLSLSSLRVAQLVAAAARAAGRQPPVAPLLMADASIAEMAEVIAELPPLTGDNDTSGLPVPGVAHWVRCFAETAYPDHTQRRGQARAHVFPARRAPADQPEGACEAAAGARRRLTVDDPLRQDEIARVVRAARKAVADGEGFGVVAESDALAGFVRSLHLEHPALFADDLRPERLPIALPGDGPLPVGAGDVVLVSGGGKGIGFACAAGLAEAAGCALALVGRASPEDDPALRANLAALTERGVRHAYAEADVADEAATARAVRTLTNALGPVTMLIHAAGVNRPAAFAELTDEEIAAHISPKVTGLLHLVAAASPKHIVTFGSVIGRYGMAGESHYALANGLMREQTRRLGGLNVDWTVWSGAGMGERLGVLESLTRSDVTAIPEREGVEVFLRLLRTPGLPPSVAVHGRLGERPVPCPGRGRFLNEVRVHYPGVELVADSVLSLATDTYLDGHRVDGLAVLPAVVAIEAMAQAAAVLAGRPLPEVTDLSFDRPVIVPDVGATAIRVCALRHESAIEVVLRSEESGYAVDHFRAVFPVAPSHAVADLSDTGVAFAGEPLADGDVYGELCFHTGRFRRVRRLTHVEPSACAGEIAGDHLGGWFGDTAPLLGSPGVTDATIHALQACVPHRQLLPVGAGRFTARPGGAQGDLRLRAAERHSGDGEYIWDVEAVDTRGNIVAAWSGLRLKDVGPLPRREPWPPGLLPVYLQRTAVALGLSPALRVSLDRPEVGGSRSYLDGHVLSVSSPATCDWERVGGAVPALGPGLSRLVNELQPRCDEPRDTVATRVWNAVECLSKAGLPPTAPLTVAGVFEGGWALLRSGSQLIASTVVRMRGVDEAVAVAIMAEGRG